MPTIYKNTFLGCGLSLVPVVVLKDSNHTYSTVAIAAINLIDLFVNKGYTIKKSLSPKKVFFSPTQEEMEDCSFKQKEFSYTDFGAKILSLVLAPIAFYYHQSDKYLALAPALAECVSSTMLDLYECEYAKTQMKCTDAYGTYIDITL